MGKSAEQNAVEKLSGLKESACACNFCKSMCHKAPCLGTPADILRLINNGHRFRLMHTTWMTGFMYAKMPVIDMVQLQYELEEHRCTFLMEGDRCALHQDGLKPLEGKIATHHGPDPDSEKIPPAYSVAALWLHSKNEKTIRLINLAMEKQHQHDQDTG